MGPLLQCCQGKERVALTLRQLEDILLAVDDSQRALWSELAHVAGVEPAVGRQVLLCLGLVFVVAPEERGAADYHLPPRRTAGCAQRVQPSQHSSTKWYPNLVTQLSS